MPTTTPTTHTTHTVTIRADGTFHPRRQVIESGDIVQWRLAEPIADCVIPVDVKGNRVVVRPYDPDDRNNLTGPLPKAPGGIWCMSDDDAPYPIDPAIWASDALNGVYLRWRWNDIQVGAGDYFWDDLDARMDEAVEANKLVSLSFKAGYKGTPQDMLDRGPDPIPGLLFRGESGNKIGSPCNTRYAEIYSDFLAKVGEHLRSRADWFRLIGYIKPAGANKWSSEGRLPWKHDSKVQETKWIRKWATIGEYTPSGLYAFFYRQLTTLRDAFPGKTQSYQQIHAGYPPINDKGEYRGQKPHDPQEDPPRVTEQTRKIINLGAELLGLDWAVQHNGLQPERRGANCPSRDEIDRRFDYVGSSCPNRWTQAAYLNNGSPTGYQTAHVRTRGLGGSLANMWKNSWGMFFETYMRYLLPLLDGKVMPGSTLALAEANAQLNERRSKLFDDALGPVFPETWSHRFFRTQDGGGVQTIDYFNGRNHDARGAIMIKPPTGRGKDEPSKVKD